MSFAYAGSVREEVRYQNTSASWRTEPDETGRFQYWSFEVHARSTIHLEADGTRTFEEKLDYCFLEAQGDSMFSYTVFSDCASTTIRNFSLSATHIVLSVAGYDYLYHANHDESPFHQVLFFQSGGAVRRERFRFTRGFADLTTSTGASFSNGEAQVTTGTSTCIGNC